MPVYYNAMWYFIEKNNNNKKQRKSFFFSPAKLISSITNLFWINSKPVYRIKTDLSALKPDFSIYNRCDAMYETQ